jgi:preprotein translocase subunit SecE
MAQTKMRNGEAQAGAAPEGAVGKAMSYPRRFREFLHEVRVEMKQVTWPNKLQVRSTTGVVIATVFFFGAYLALVDTGVSRIVDAVLQVFRP